MLVQAEGLANDSADTVPRNSAAGRANRHGEAETRSTLVIPKCSHAKESIANPAPARIGRLEVRLTTQAPLRGMSQPRWGRALAGQVNSNPLPEVARGPVWASPFGSRDCTPGAGPPAAKGVALATSSLWNEFSATLGATAG
jgi:hypothetical protein